MKIIIPTYNRVNHIPALNHLPEEILNETVYLAVRDEEYDIYKQAWPNLKIHNLGKGITDIVETRQRINEQFTGKIMVMDDDVYFNHSEIASYKDDESKKFLRKGKKLETVEEFREMFSYVSNLLDHFSLGFFDSLTFIKSLDFLPYKVNSYGFWVFLINLDTFDSKNCSFRNGPPSGLNEDLYISLDWFDKGNDIFKITQWCITMPALQNTVKGGCYSTDRGLRYKQSSEEIHRMFPQYTYFKKSNNTVRLYGLEMDQIIARLNPAKRKQLYNNTSLF